MKWRNKTQSHVNTSSLNWWLCEFAGQCDSSRHWFMQPLRSTSFYFLPEKKVQIDTMCRFYSQVLKFDGISWAWSCNSLGLQFLFHFCLCRPFFVIQISERKLCGQQSEEKIVPWSPQRSQRWHDEDCKIKLIKSLKDGTTRVNTPLPCDWWFKSLQLQIFAWFLKYIVTYKRPRPLQKVFEWWFSHEASKLCQSLIKFASRTLLTNEYPIKLFLHNCSFPGSFLFMADQFVNLQFYEIQTQYHFILTST